MQFSNPDFSAAIRTLTSLGAGVIVANNNNHTALANGVNADIRPSAGFFREATLMGEPLANVTWSIQSFDGVTARTIISGASGAGFFQPFVGNNAVGQAILNSGTVSGNFSMSTMDWKL